MYHQPTVLPATPFNPKQDAISLFHAHHHSSMDHKVVMDILLKRSAAQRARIATIYKVAYGRDLTADLKAALSGNFEHLITALLFDRVHYDMHIIYQAAEERPINLALIVEAMASRPLAERQALIVGYEEELGCELEGQIYGQMGSPMKRVLLALMAVDEGERVPSELPPFHLEADVALLVKDREKNKEGRGLEKIMTYRTRAQQRQVYDAYEAMQKENMAQYVDSLEWDHVNQDAAKAYIEIVRDMVKYFAVGLYNALKSHHVDDKTLIRIVVSRSEADLGLVRQRFEEMYHVPLAKMVQAETKGDYRLALVELIGQ